MVWRGPLFINVHADTRLAVHLLLSSVLVCGFYVYPNSLAVWCWGCRVAILA